ncbi:SEC-C metal-binding domain-containing protein, partial [Emergencia timonensis]|uniref:preprotein translocase subunit SecA n=1 Tax=Emergencia timonensis TaxID=1776384 RepID=UPI003994240E
DNQLRGRSGRQGYPGQTQFFISLEDELMRLFGGERMQKIVDRMGLEEDEAIEAGMLSKSIEGAQKKVEGKNFGIRKYVLQYDNVMNKQREIIYDERRKVLFGEDLRDYIINMAHTILGSIVEPVVVESKFPEEWDFATLNKNLQKISDKFRGKTEFSTDELNAMTEESLKQSVFDEFDRIYAEKEQEIGIEQMREVERMILLRVVDNLWMDHIDAMDQLKSGIGLRALGQQDPAAAYSKEGFDMFEQMIGGIQEDTVKYCYNVTVETKTERKAIMEAGEAKKSEYIDDDMVRAMQGGGELPEEAQVPDREAKPQTVRRDHPKVGRNDPCPCGSGKKYKNCCGKNE